MNSEEGKKGETKPGATASGTGNDGAAPKAAEGPLVSLLGKPLTGPPPGGDIAKLVADLAAARQALAEKPDDVERIIWVGRRLGYQWRMQEAIDVFSEGLRKFPENAALLRHRGHRYISIRKFPEAIADLQQAAKLAGSKPDVVEVDGQPNEAGLSLTTLKFNIWYHLGVAKYLNEDYWGARDAFVENIKYCGGHDDNLVSVSDWLYLTAKKLGKEPEAQRFLKPINARMKILENHAYHRRLLLYKGELTPEQLLADPKAKGVDPATLRYGLSQWYLHQNKLEEAIKVMEEIVAGDQWPAFGFIAAEVELKQLKK